MDTKPLLTLEKKNILLLAAVHIISVDTVEELSRPYAANPYALTPRDVVIVRVRAEQRAGIATPSLVGAAATNVKCSAVFLELLSRRHAHVVAKTGVTLPAASGMLHAISAWRILAGDVSRRKVAEAPSRR